MTTQTKVDFGKDLANEISASSGEPAWMAAERQQALELAGRLELPKVEKTRIERWSLDSYGRYVKPGNAGTLSELPQEALRLLKSEQEESNLLVQRNSGVVYQRLSDDLKRQGVVFTDLQSALHSHEAIVRKHFMSVVKKDENRLTALHAALWNGGVFLYIPKNVQVAEPLHAVFLSDDAGAAFAPHVLIVAEQGSSVAYVDNYLSAGNSGDLVHNGIVEVVAGANAQVNFSSVHNLGPHITDLSIRRAFLEQDARMQWIVGEMNNGNGLSETHSILSGNGSFSDAKVICVGTGEQQLSITTKATHIGKSSFSDMITRAVMRDSSTAIINGITKIEKGATKANGEQTEKVLMLNPKARGDANPMLLIDEDDVKAGHAASVGQVSAEQIYYLMARGISKEEAMRLIIYGFLAPVVSTIPIEQVEEQLKGVVERKLGQS